MLMCVQLPNYIGQFKSQKTVIVFQMTTYTLTILYLFGSSNPQKAIKDKCFSHPTSIIKKKKTFLKWKHFGKYIQLKKKIQ